MVQGYAQANTPNPGGWCTGIQRGNSCGSDTLQGISPYGGNHLHEQWCVYQAEELKLREPSGIRGETGGLMLTIFGKTKKKQKSQLIYGKNILID